MLDNPDVRRKCRLVCTTSRDLSESVQEGAFDEALYRKLSLGAKIVIPTLIDRRWDIPPLIVSFLNEKQRESIRYVSYAALLFFVQFNWSGEIEQLLSVLDGVSAVVSEKGGTTITLREIIDHFRRVCVSPSEPLAQPDSEDDGFLPGSAQEAADHRRWLLQKFGSPEIAQFFEDQYRDEVFTDPQSDQEFEGGGWRDFDRDRWTGCMELTGNSHVAWEFNLFMQQQARVPLEADPKPAPETPPAGNEPEDAEQQIRRREREAMDELRRKVKPVALDDSYGAAPCPSLSIVGDTILVKLDFNPLFASPIWLEDENWRLRDSWNVPLDWADSQITLSVKGMAEELKDFLLIPGARETLATQDIEAHAPEAATEVDTAVQQPQNLFIFEGAAWKLAFGGDAIQVKDMKGLHYIAALLRSPNQWFPAATLRGTVDSPDWIKEGRVDDSVPGDSDEEPSGHKPSQKSQHSDTLIDERTRLECAKKLRELKADCDAAVARDDLDAAAEIDARIEKIEQYLGTATGLAGRTREFSDANSKTAQAIARAIRYAIDKIKTENPQLAIHLTSSIELGLKLRYAPEIPVDWLIS